MLKLFNEFCNVVAINIDNTTKAIGVLPTAFFAVGTLAALTLLAVYSISKTDHI